MKVDPREPEPAAVRRAVDVWQEGGLVAFPTETVYGLGAPALDAWHVGRIFRAKGRPGWNPLIVHVLDVPMARTVVETWPTLAQQLADRFWPGPLTLVLPRSEAVPDAVTAGLGTVAVRAPLHPVARALIAAWGAPLAAPSANPFQAISATEADHVAKGLGEEVDLLLDGGRVDVGVESTVVDLSRAVPTVLRPGGITQTQLRDAFPDVDWSREAPGAVEGEARAAPGMVQKHYAPDAQVRLVPHGNHALWLHACREMPRPLGTVGFSLPAPADAHAAWLPLEPTAAQQRFFSALHALEDASCRGIVIEEPPAGDEWEALRDRARRAAG